MKPIFINKFGIVLSAIWKKLSLLEKIFIFFLLLVVIFEILNIGKDVYYSDSDITPEKGGVLAEGMLGRPKIINPLFARSEADKTLSSLVFSGLVAYNENREIIPSLAEKWEISEDKKEYRFYLRKNLLWHDGYPLNAEDIFYTVAVLQNPDYNESLKYAWSGIRIEKNSDYAVTFYLPDPYPFFLDNLTVGILPHHLWVDIPVKDFDKSILNTNAIGSGPYKISEVIREKDGQVASLKMKSNPNFSLSLPNIENLEIKFYDGKENLLKGFYSREFSSFGIYASEDSNSVKKTKGYDNYNVFPPQYIALFFNQKRSRVLSDKAIRQALAYAIDKKEINKNSTYGAGIIIDSPILPDYLGYDSEIKKYEYDIQKASTILSQSEWIDSDNDGIKEKGDEKLLLNLVIPNQQQFIKIADLLDKWWGKIGVKLNVTKVESSDLENNYIQNRNYDILLIGENLGSDPDPYSYWHSSQINYPGLNLSLYENGEADKLLEEARQSADANVRIKNYKKFQEIIADDLPAIFLYQPAYVYKIYDKVKGVNLSRIKNTSDRFYNIYNWFVKFEKR